MRRQKLHEKTVPARRPAARNKQAAAAGLNGIYRLLLGVFGPQGWWPYIPPGGASPAYFPGRHGSLPEAAMFEICCGSILTQNTSWMNVEKALSALSAGGLLAPRVLAKCPLPRLERVIRSSGYYRQKALRLRSFVRRALREHPEGLKAWFAAAPAASLRAELLDHPGIGPETADCMVLYAGGKATFVIDAYTRRICERAGLGRGLSYDGWKAMFEAALPPDVKKYNEYHALLVKLGKDFCRKTKPLCAGCPLDPVCLKRNIWKK